MKPMESSDQNTNDDSMRKEASRGSLEGSRVPIK